MSAVQRQQSVSAMWLDAQSSMMDTRVRAVTSQLQSIKKIQKEQQQQRTKSCNDDNKAGDAAIYELMRRKRPCFWTTDD